VAHSLEDQAETFLLRLARGSGIDGLSGMAPVAPFPSPGCDDVVLVRPLLETQRGRLRRFLEERNETWVEDPMNVDPRFARARLRSAWPMLETLGLTPERIALAARHLARARLALDEETEALLARTCRFDGDRAVIDGAAFALVSPEIGLRAFAAILMRMAGQTYRPRFRRLEQLFALIRGGRLETARTLHGCRIARAPRRHAFFGTGTLTVAREEKRSRPGRGPVN
jgi:tRNA(Ile)-lysidine synthase